MRPTRIIPTLAYSVGFKLIYEDLNTMVTETQAGSNTTDKSLLTQLSEAVNVKIALTAFASFMILYIYAPILSLIAFSFNSGGLTFPFVDFTTDWYTVLFNNQGFIDATVRSLQLAIVVTIITTVLSTAAALAYRYDFWGQRGILYLLILGIITPGVTYGVGASLFFGELLGLNTGLWLATPVHVVWTIPFAVIILLAGFPRNLAENERAARVMGADRWTRFREVILPQIAPTVLGAAVFAFTLSYNEATRGLLLVGQDSTLPIAIFAEAAGTRATPQLFALGSVTTIFSTILLAIGGGIILYTSN